jgi:hypothetical protein
MARTLITAGFVAAVSASLWAGPATAQLNWLFGEPQRPQGNEQASPPGAPPARPPASAQAAPPRPPANVPSAPMPLGLPQQMPPEEMDDDVAPPPQQARPAPAIAPPQQGARPTPGQLQPPPGVAARPAAPPTGGISSQPLAPPPGASAVAPGAPPAPGQLPQVPGQQQPAGAQPGQPGQQQAAIPPGQRPQTGRPGGDEVVQEMPSQKITNPTAIFAGLDKITGRIITFDVAINETVQFGALQVTPRVCYTRPPTEPSNTDAFADVDEVTLQGEVKRIFTGWMFASSPGLHAVEHPIYDVWLTDCKGGAVAAEAPTPAVAPAGRPPGQRASAPAGTARQVTPGPGSGTPARSSGQPQQLQPRPQPQQPQSLTDRVPPPPLR